MWTAQSLWMPSVMSSTSSHISIAWLTSGSRLFVVSYDFIKCQCNKITQFTFLHSKFLWEGSQRVGVSPSKQTDLEYSAFIRPDASVVLIILNRYRVAHILNIHECQELIALKCECIFRSPSVIKFEVWDPAVGFIPSLAPAHSLITLSWNTYWSLIQVYALLVFTHTENKL